MSCRSLVAFVSALVILSPKEVRALASGEAFRRKMKTANGPGTVGVGRLVVGMGRGRAT